LSEDQRASIGSIGWIDLTVNDAEAVRDFYRTVVGWTANGLEMGGYEDFVMMPPGSEIPAAGICHARGGNADLPPQWLVYITVADLDESVNRCVELGGRVIAGPKDGGDGSRYCVIQDPAGAYAALFCRGQNADPA
jgi:predicted enzyme related to lactoylglutathione lyase